MRFEQLLRNEDFGIAVVHAGTDALAREVTGAYITDLPDPSRFISAGDVVLTSGLWSGQPEAAESFVAALARKNVAALIVGLVYLGQVPDEVLALCRKHDVTLATISDRTSFKSVGEAVSAAQGGSTSGLIARGMRFTAHVAELTAAGEPAEAVLREFTTEFAIGCWLIDDIGTVVGSSGARPPSPDVGQVWNALIASTATGAHLVDGFDGAQFTAWPIVGTQRQVVGYFVCEGDQRAFSRNAPIIVDGLIGALRVDLEFSARWRRTSLGNVSDLVRVLSEDSVSPGEISARMRLEGLDPQAATSIAVAEVADPQFPPSAVLEMAYTLLSDRATSVTGCVIDSRAVLLVNGVDDTAFGVDEAAIHALAGQYLPFLAGRQLRIGMSDPRAGVSQLGSSIVTATERLRDARLDGPIVVAASSELKTHRAILAQLGERGRAVFAREVLAPLLDYDIRHGADLVSTLRVFLGNAGAWQESARQLHLHTNTLRYRIARIEELTGRSLGDMSDRVDFFLALGCLDG